MSEINVSLIQDEDVLRRMWQQTEDFSKKKEIRTHMYRLREERLRNLYSPEPKPEAKGCEFTSSATHVASFADQNFQSMKSKEVRDAGSPPKEFTYRGQDLKEYSNAGWNVESEDSARDGGATRVRALHATVEGRYDVEGGAGGFAAADSQRRATTELRDARSVLLRDETTTATAARDHLDRTAPDGTRHVSTATSSTTSNVKLLSETRTEPDRDTNTDERHTTTTNRNDYEQTTRRINVDSGDLVSRKVEYPDDNTKVIVETRCLPDGTRVTSTRREFRVPAQHTSVSRHEAHHRTHSDTTARRATTATTADIVDTQRNRDETDFRRQIQEYTTATDNNDSSAIHRTSERRELKTDRNVSDYSQTDNYSQTHRTTRVNDEVIDRSTSDRNELARTQRDENERISEDVDETGRRGEIITTTRDDRIPKRDVDDTHRKNTFEERVQKITKDSKVEEVVERKTTSDRYQTTYQTDYQQRKVSEDLSPTHQAWASTLRSDTPSTTRPSTRASSPGSRTFQSSTSSLRSSVSPDKYKKPSSRGGSPSKIDRFSPTRTVTSDRYSDTHSTCSLTETKTNKYTSPERKPPSVQRPSTSPEKRPQSFRPSQSPERKPTQSTPDRFRSSPTRTTPARSPTRRQQSPEKPVHSQYPRTSSPSRTNTPDSAKYPEASPEREVGYRKYPNREENYEKRPSTSPDRKPGYMRPTAASQPTPDIRRPSRPGEESDRKSPSKHSPTSSPDRKKTIKVVEDHYKFVDEETKVNIRNQNVRIDTKYKTPSIYDSSPRQKSPSPKRQTPKDSESSPAPRGKTPQKDKITETENDELYGRIDKTVEIIDIKETDDTKVSITKNLPSNRNSPQRETSPSKYDTYDKKKPRETITTEIVTESIDDSVKYDSLTRHDTMNKAPEPLSPTKKSPREITSPTKSPTKDVKYKHTTDFISTEKYTEEINKKNISKSQPRQLTTPSSSPTRKPKAAEPEPSTGQSSPTTSVSGFVYFGSPRHQRPLVTDLDDESDNVNEPNYDRPDTLDVKRSPTPSKIPCRSPSPEQRPSLPKDSLPRKSSLKKPSAPPAEPNLASPMEKPPTSFRVSPTEDKPNIPDHRVVKKDQASPVKPKPPLQRRETYEDRCRKILGMVEDTTAEMVTKETKKHTKRTDSEQSSQSVSPCDSPAPKETCPFDEFSTINTKITDTNTDVTDFISREIDENIKTTKTTKNKSPSREKSPAKLQDIISKKTSVLEHETESNHEETVNENQSTTRLTTRKTQTKDVPRRSNTSPKKTTQQTPTPATRSMSPTKPIPAERTSVSPTRKPSREKETKDVDHPKDDSPTRRTPGKTSVYSTTTSTVTLDTAKDTTNITSTNKTRSRILESPTREVPSRLRDDSPKYRADDKPRTNPEKSPTRTTTRKIQSSKHDTSTTVRTDITKTTKTSVSPTRRGPQTQPRESSPTKSSPTRKPKKPESSPERKPIDQTREPQKSNIKSSSPTRPNQNIPGYMKTTTSSITKQDTAVTAENIQETITSKRTDRKHSGPSPAVSPTRKPSETHTPSPTKKTRPSNLPKTLERSPERTPNHQQPSSPVKSADNHPATKSPSRPSPDRLPGYMKTTTSTSSKFENTSVTDVHDTFTSLTEKRHSTTRYPGSPRSSPDRGTPDYRSESPSRPSITNDRPSNRSASLDHKPRDSTTKIPGYMRPTEAAIHKFETTMVTDVEETIIPTDRSDSPSYDSNISPDSAPTVPGYMRPTEAAIHRFDFNVVTDVEETISSKTMHRESPEPVHRSDSPSNRTSLSPDHKPQDSAPKTPGYMRPTEAVIHKFDSTVVTDVEEIVSSKTIHRKSPVPVDKSNSPDSRRSVSPDHKTNASVPKTPGYMRPTEAVMHKFDSTDVEETVTSKTIHRKSPEPVDRSDSPDLKVKDSALKTPGYMRTTEAVTNKFESTTVTEVEHTVHGKSPEPTDYPNKRISPEKKIERASPVKDYPAKPAGYYPTVSPTRSGVSSDREVNHKRPTTATTSKFESRATTQDFQKATYHLTKPEETKQLRTPSPIKKTIAKMTDMSSEVISSEKEQEIMDKVQKSLRKLSPDRKEKSPSPPSRERTPSKSTLSLEDLDIITTSETEYTQKFTGKKLSEVVEEHVTTKTKIAQPNKPTDKFKNQKILSKPTSRNTSPTKKPSSTPAKIEKSPESPTKSRSISPKKPFSQSERPQSPKVSKVSGIKQREPLHSVLTRKPTPATIKIERLPSDIKRTHEVTKQTITVKTSTTPKTTTRPLSSPTRKTFEPETKRVLTPKGIKEPISPKKETVTRTTSDNSMKPKKTSPQRMRSKPEIQISDMSPKSPKSQKPSSKLPTKPKSATALNTSLDEEEDFTVDLQQSKSSRENSPDRICPTPVNFTEDVGTPRFPDEVSEPDDEYRRRTYNTIHETESVVDDIVEICEDEELFIKKTDKDVITEEDDSLLSVTDKVTKFTNKIESVKKPKDTYSAFKDTERRVHSDFTVENLKSDECLLSVSEKVNKFVKGPRDLTDNHSSTKRIVDEYDKDTIYQDDYTKLSVNDKAHLFVETAENIKTSKPKPAQKVERPDLSNVEESLKTDECLLSVSDKVNKFVKTTEKFMTETTEVGDNEKKVKEQHERLMKKFVDDEKKEIFDVSSTVTTAKVKTVTDNDQKSKATSSKIKDFSMPRSKLTERTPTVKITTLRSSEAVKKAKALFENIASTQTKEINTTKTTKLTDIGVIKKSSKTDSTTVLHPSVEDISPNVTDGETEIISQTPSHEEKPSSETLTRQLLDDKPRSSLNRLTAQSPEVPRSKSPLRQSIEVSPSKTVLSRYPAAVRAESPSYRPESPRPRSEADKHVPGYLKPTKTSQLKEETKVTEENEVSTRRGSGKFGVELRRTSVERSTVSSERRRSVDHHQPCIEDIYDLDLLEQMLEKVTGYEQRRRIRSQIRIVKKESEHIDSTNTYTTTVKQTTHVQTSSPRPRSPNRQPARSPERAHKSTPQKTASPDRSKTTPQRVAPERNQTKTTPYMNGHAKEPTKNVSVTRQRPASPEKPVPKSAAKSPVRHPSPEKKQTLSPSKITPKQKPNRFNEYASAYMKKVQLNETDKVQISDINTKKVKDLKQTIKHDKQENVQEFTTTKSFSERKSSKDVVEIFQMNGKRSSSPEKRQSPVRKHQSPERTAQSPERSTKTSERKAQSPERLYQRTPSPDFKRPRAEAAKDTIVKTIYDIDKKTSKASVQEEKPSWVTNRNLKKVTSETRTFSSKKIETEKGKYRATVTSPSKVIVKPTDVITSSYGPGPLDADGRPLFGIKALRNGATNLQVKGTVIRQEYHSRNGGEPEGTVSVTAYSSQPEDLQQLLADQSVEPPSRLHGLSAITTTKKFGGDTGNTYSNVHTKEERASLEQFTHTDRKVVQNNQIEEVAFDKVDSNERRVQPSEKRREENEVKRGQKNVRQSSVKSLTEKFIKGANDTSKVDRSSYPKAGLILRTTTLRDSVSSDDAPGLHRTESEHSLNDEAFEHVESTRTSKTTRTDMSHPGRTRTTVTDGSQPGRTRTTVMETSGQPGRSTRTVRTTTVVQEPVVTSVTRTERSFLDSNTKVTGVQDILTRMKNADIVIQEGDSSEEQEARALLNKFLGATVLMAGMQGYVNEEPTGNVHIQESSVRSSSAGNRVSSSTRIEEIDLDHCWDEQLLRKLLDECTDYEQRRRLRARIRSLMAEQEACANAVTEALGCAATEARTRGDGDAGAGDAELREEEEVTVSSSVRRDSTEKTVTNSTTTTKTSKVLESMTRSGPKPVSPFAKFRQLEKQNSTNSPNSPKSPQSPGSPSQPYFKFTDPALQTSALTIKERLLQWCRDKTRDYENVKLENFSTSWADGLAFCALVHHFLPDAFDYSKLTADKRRHNFTLAFKVADEKAGIYPLLDVDDMVAMRKPDWKCVFTYVQSIHRRFKDER